ncbi:MAG: hypothetical protein Q4F61_03090 [Candidatus Saccharibacteria bacterium]|nr:hypothetical protein [Candidatus Saccharibacteria bacterium]
MGSTLNLLYDYTQDLKSLIEKADELAKKSLLKDELSRFQESTFDFENLSIRETEHLVSLSRILVDYGLSQTYESFESACALLTADYDRTKEMVDAAVEKLKKSASQLYDGEVDFLWKVYETDDPWVLLTEIRTGSSGESTARRNFYLKKIAELASPKNLVSAMFNKKSNEVALELSPLRLEMDFVTNDGILPEILSQNKTDLC